MFGAECEVQGAMVKCREFFRQCKNTALPKTIRRLPSATRRSPFAIRRYFGSAGASPSLFWATKTKPT